VEDVILEVVIVAVEEIRIYVYLYTHYFLDPFKNEVIKHLHLNKRFSYILGYISHHLIWIG
jgi:hypothetical protein